MSAYEVLPVEVGPELLRPPVGTFDEALVVTMAGRRHNLNGVPEAPVVSEEERLAQLQLDEVRGLMRRRLGGIARDGLVYGHATRTDHVADRTPGVAPHVAEHFGWDGATTEPVGVDAMDHEQLLAYRDHRRSERSFGDGHRLLVNHRIATGEGIGTRLYRQEIERLYPGLLDDTSDEERDDATGATRVDSVVMAHPELNELDQLGNSIIRAGDVAYAGMGAQSARSRVGARHEGDIQRQRAAHGGVLRRQPIRRAIANLSNNVRVAVRGWGSRIAQNLRERRENPHTYVTQDVMTDHGVRRVPISLDQPSGPKHRA